MVALNLEGSSLGARHKNLNQIINESIKSKKPFEEIVDIPETSDVVRLYKIAIASEYKHVDYIIQNFCCDDLFYATVAINKSKWLIADGKYSNIINPDYLNNELYPKMLSQAVNKLALAIRLNLKEAERVETFFHYYKENSDLKTTFKWLKNCSVNFKREIIKEYYSKMDDRLLKVLCELDTEVFQILASIEDYSNSALLTNFKFMLYVQPETYLNLFEKEVRKWSYFNCKGRRFVEFLMKNHKERVLSNLKTYKNCLNWKVAASYLSEVEIKDLIELNSTEAILSADQIKTLIKYLPEEERFQFVKKMFLEKKERLVSSENYEFACCYTDGGYRAPTYTKDYSWYNYASFDVAFKELKPFINTSANYNERIDIISVFVKTARKNEKNIQTLLEYFMRRHINEPLNVRQMFAKHLVKSTGIPKYSEGNWKLINELFHSLEVYKEGGLSYCRNAIIVYNLLHDIDVPTRLIEYLKEDDPSFSKISAEYKQQLDSDEIFRLYGFLLNEMNKPIMRSPFNKDKVIDAISEDEFLKSYKAISDKIDFLTFWEKDFAQYPDLINFLKHLMQWKFETKSKQNIYGFNKEIKRLIFEDLFKVEPDNKTLMYTLKHDVDLINKHKDIVNKITLERLPLKRFVYKVRVYFSNDLAESLLQMYLANLTSIVNEEKGHKEIVQGICFLMQKEELEKKIVEYFPEKYKISWSEEMAGMLNVRKHFAINMYRVRPLLDLNIVMKFADGDYLKWSIPSLTQLCYNIQNYKFKEWIPILMSGPISLKKLSLRFAANKLKIDGLLDVYDKVWIKLNHPSIRAILFKGLRSSIIKEKNEVNIQRKWVLLKKFLAELTFEEDRLVYPLLSQSKALPNSVKCEYFLLGYKILKSLPNNLQCQAYVDYSMTESIELINEIDDNFYVEVILQRFDDLFIKKKVFELKSTTDFEIINLLVIFLNKSLTESSLINRYNSIMPIVFNKCKDIWTTNDKQMKKAAKEFIFSVVDILDVQTGDLFEHKFANLSVLFENILTTAFDIWDPLTMYQQYLTLHFELFLWQTVRDVGVEDDEFVPRVNSKMLDLLKKHKNLYFSEIFEPFKETVIDFWMKKYYLRKKWIQVAKNFAENTLNADSVCIGIYFLHKNQFRNDEKAIIEEAKSALKDLSKSDHRIRLTYSLNFSDIDQ